MFVCVARVTLDVPAGGNLKAKRQVLRRVTDRVKAKFNCAVAEVEDTEFGNRATIAVSVVGNERRHVQEMMDKITHYVDDLYVAPVASKESEIIPFDDIFSATSSLSPDLQLLTVPRGERSLAEAEGLGSWEDRYAGGAVPPPPPSAPNRRLAGSRKPQLSLEDARAVARGLRNRREWEKEPEDKE